MWWSPEYQPYCDGSIQRSSWKISSDAPPTEKLRLRDVFRAARGHRELSLGRLMLWPSCR